MKKIIQIAIIGILLLATNAVIWLWPAKTPGGVEGWSRGNTTGFINLHAGVVAKDLNHILLREGFEPIADKPFTTIVQESGGHQRQVFSELIALHDANTKTPNQLYLGVGSGTVIYYHEQHDGTTKEVEEWQKYVARRIEPFRKQSPSTSH